MPSPWQWLYSSRRKYDFSTDNGRSSGRQSDSPRAHPGQPAADRDAKKPFWKRKAGPAADAFLPFSDSVQTSLLGAQGRWRALTRTESTRSVTSVAEVGPHAPESCDMPSARQAKRSESFLQERLGRDMNMHGHLWDRPERSCLCLASTSDWLARKSAVDRAPARGRDGQTRRPHVRDIFSDLHMRSTTAGRIASPVSSAPSDSELRPTERRETKPESMVAYVPRTVDDAAISAALVGGRIDDYNPNPDWNHALGSFASSPASRAGLALPDRIENHQTSRGNTLAVTADIRVHSSSWQLESTRSQAIWSDTNETKSEDPADVKYSAMDGCSEFEMTSTGMSTDDPNSHFSVGQIVELEAVFSSNVEVLY